MTIEIRIDELLLHGFALLDRARFCAELERELQRLIAARGLPEDAARAEGGPRAPNAGGPDEQRSPMAASAERARAGGGPTGGSPMPWPPDLRQAPQHWGRGGLLQRQPDAQLAAHAAAALYDALAAQPQLRVATGARVPPRPSSLAPLPSRGGAARDARGGKVR